MVRVHLLGQQHALNQLTDGNAAILTLLLKHACAKRQDICRSGHKRFYKILSEHHMSLVLVSSATAAYISEEVLFESQAAGKALHDNLHHLVTFEHEVQHLLPACQDCIRCT